MGWVVLERKNSSTITDILISSSGLSFFLPAVCEKLTGLHDLEKADWSKRLYEIAKANPGRHFTPALVLVLLP